MSVRKCLYDAPSATQVTQFLLPNSSLQFLGVLGPQARLRVRDSPGLDFHTQRFITEVEEALLWDQPDLKRREHWAE